MIEQAHRPALAHHVHRPPRLGPSVLISARWYNRLKLLDSFARRGRDELHVRLTSDVVGLEGRPKRHPRIRLEMGSLWAPSHNSCHSPSSTSRWRDGPGVGLRFWWP